jgi:hypothetical protein
VAAGLALLVCGCTAAYGAAVGVAIAGAAVLTHACYDFIVVQVLDAATGSRLCDAEVTATEDGSTTKLLGCHHAHLSDGVWVLRASRAGYAEATTKVQVAHPEGCQRNVQSINLTLVPGGYAPSAPVVVPAPAAPPSPALAPAPAPGPTTTGTQAPAPAPGPPVRSFPPAPSAE